MGEGSAHAKVDFGRHLIESVDGMVDGSEAALQQWLLQVKPKHSDDMRRLLPLVTGRTLESGI